MPEIHRLLSAKQWKSATFLASMLVSKLGGHMRAQAHPQSRALYIDALVLYADALVGGGECRRALAHYSSALSWMKSNHAPNGAHSSQASTTECLLRVKIAEAYLRLNDHPKALEHLEKVNVSATSSLSPDHILFVLMQRAQCYKRRGSRDVAIEAYKTVLQRNPFCVEAITGE